MLALSDCYVCCSDDITQRCGGYFRISIYQREGARFSPRPQQSQCIYNGPARATVTLVSTTDSTGGVTQYSSTGPTNYGPITTGSTVILIMTTDSNGVTTVYESTTPLCDGPCNANSITPVDRSAPPKCRLTREHMRLLSLSAAATGKAATTIFRAESSTLEFSRMNAP